MALLDNIATASSPTASPSAKWIGRPSRACSKCKSPQHWVNTMGGLQCLKCSPPPAEDSPNALKDLDGRKIIAVAGVWEKDDGTHLSQATSHNAQRDISNQNDTFHSQNLFVDLGANGACYRDSVTGDYVFQNEFVGTWLNDEKELVDWFIQHTEPASAELRSLTSRLQGKRISPWEVVRDASRLLADLRGQCILGPSGPRNCYGGLISDLRRLFVWLNDARRLRATDVASTSRLPGDESGEAENGLDAIDDDADGFAVNEIADFPGLRKSQAAIAPTVIDPASILNLNLSALTLPPLTLSSLKVEPKPEVKPLALPALTLPPFNLASIVLKL